MKNGRCVKCQAGTVYKIDTSGYARQGIVISSRVRAGVTYYVCSSCGYSESYIPDPKMLAKIAESKPHVRQH